MKRINQLSLKTWMNLARRGERATAYRGSSTCGGQGCPRRGASNPLLKIFALAALTSLACGQLSPTTGATATATAKGPTATPATSVEATPTPRPEPTATATPVVQIARPGSAVGAGETTASGLPVYRVLMAPEDWTTLTTTDPATLGNTEFPIAFLSGEVNLPGAIRLRGASTRYFNKKSFKVDFDKGFDFQGRKELNLLASEADPTFLMEKFWYDVFAQTGALVSRAEHAELYVNDAYYGLMLDVESVSSKRFLTPHGLEEDATIYRTNWYFDFRILPTLEDYQYQVTKDTNKDDPSWDEAVVFTEGLNLTPDDQFAAWLPQHMDLEAYINYMVGDTLTSQDWMAHSRSFVIHEPESGQWWWVPWDLLNSATTNIYPGVFSPPYVTHPPLIYTVYEYAYHPLTHGPDVYPPAEWSVLKTRVIDDPTFRAMYIARLEETLNTTFTPEALGPYVDEQYAKINPSALADPIAQPEVIQAGPDWLKQYIAGRREYLLGQLEWLKALGQTGLYLNEVGEGWVELYNATGADWDISGYYLSPSLHEPDAYYTFSNGSVVPAGGYLVVTDFYFPTAGGELGLFKPATLEEALAGDSGTLDFVYYPALTSTTAYGRTTAGTESWALQQSLTPGY